jgi:hypothetical protein
MESLSNQIEQQAVPQIQMAMKRWKKRVIITDLVIFIPLVVGLIVLSVIAGYWQGFTFNPPWLGVFQQNKWLGLAAIGGGALFAYLLHQLIRSKLVNGVAKKLSTDDPYGNISSAFRKNTRWWRSIFKKNPVGWNNKTQRNMDGIRSDIDEFVQTLNDRYTSPAGNDDK